MPIQLIVLSDIPDDEAEEIRALLGDNNVDYYETPRGNWYGSLDAIWLKDNSQEDKARELLASFQNERLQSARERYIKLEETRRDKSVLERIKLTPALFGFYLIIFCFLFLAILFGLKRWL